MWSELRRGTAHRSREPRRARLVRRRRELPLFAITDEHAECRQSPTALCLDGPKWAVVEETVVQLDSVGCVACDVPNGDMELPEGQTTGESGEDE